MKMENEKKILIITSLLEYLSQIINALYKNQGKQNDENYETKAIFLEEPTFIRTKKTFKRNRSYQNSSYAMIT